MRNVMVRCIFSALLVGLLNVIRAQDQRGFHWSDQQVLADEWQPFVPSFLSSHDRPVHSYARPDTVRQFFGKTVEPLPPQGPAAGAGGALLKKSFQASSANNVDHYSAPPILTSFNSFGVPAVQTRNPLLDKNIKDGGHFLEQSSHLHGKYHQPVHRLPAYVSQYQPSNIQYHHHQQQQQQPQQFQNNQFLTRLENQPKQTPVLIQPPSRAVSTSVQVFPPSQQSQYAPNTYFLGVPLKESDELSPNRKQTRPDDFLSSNGAGTIYGHESAAASAAAGLNVLPPALSHRPPPSPFSPTRPEPNHFLYDNVRPSLPDRYETINGFAGRTPAAYYEPHNVKHVTESTKTAQEDMPPPNPSKQVFEQLSHFGRPFSLPKESNALSDYNRVKAASEAKGDVESLSSYSAVPPPPLPFKKEKAKPLRYYAKDEGDVIGYRAPSKNMYLPGSAVPPAPLAVDYEPGKLQSVKTVTYFPQTDVIRFSEQDVSGNVNEYQYPPVQQSGERYSSANSGGGVAFLPTPTESHDDVAGATFSPVDKFATPQSVEAVTKARNHKYSNVRNGVDDDGTRSRYHHRHQQPLRDESGAYSAEDQRTKYSSVAGDLPEMTTTTIIHKTPGRRRKPSKTKNKDYDSVGSNGIGTMVGGNQRYRGNGGQADRTTSTENYEISVASDSNDAPATESASRYKKKHSQPTTIRTTATTAAPSEDDYPNYPNYPNYPTQSSKRYNYPTDSRHTDGLSEYESSASAASADGADYFNAEKEDGDNYPSLKIRPKVRPTGFGSAGNSDSPITTETTTASSSRTRVKSKYGGVTATAAVAGNSTRPRFSIKEYRRTSTASPSSSTASSTSEAAVDEVAALEKKKNRKQLFAMRSKNKTETATASVAPTAAGDEPSPTRKYKPRVRPSKYKNASLSLTTATTLTEATTTQRVNTFRPAAAAGNRYRSSTSKYYNRYRATTESPAEDAVQDDDNDKYDDSGYGKKSDTIDTNDDSAPASSDAKPTRIAPLFSAKRPSASLTKPVASESEDNDEDADDSGGVRKSVAIAANVASDEPKKEAKKSSSRYKQTVTKLAAADKADDVAQTSIMTSSEEQAEKDERKNSVSNDRPEHTISLARDGDDDEDDASSFEDDDDAGEERSHDYSGKRDEHESGDREVPKTVAVATDTAEPTATVKPEETTEGTSPPPTVVAEERKDDDRGAEVEGGAGSAKYDDDDGERVSKVSSLTSQSGSPNRVGLYQQWRPPVLTVGRVTTIKKTSD